MMRSGDLAPTVFTTVGLRDACRVELWEEHNATALIGLEVRAPEPLQATELNVQLPKVHLARVVGSAHVVERTARVIGRSPAEAVVVYVSLRGDSWFQHLGGTRSLRAGTAVVYETDRPFARGFVRGLEELVVKLPRQAIGARAGQLTLPSPLTYGQDDPYVRALAQIVGGATQTGRAVAADESTVLDIVAVLAAGRNVACAVAHRAAARAFIEEHLTDCPGSSPPMTSASPGTFWSADCSSPARSCRAPPTRSGPARSPRSPADAALRRQHISPTPSAGASPSVLVISGTRQAPDPG
jgi:hypothetical protein